MHWYGLADEVQTGLLKQGWQDTLAPPSRNWVPGGHHISARLAPFNMMLGTPTAQAA